MENFKPGNYKKIQEMPKSVQKHFTETSDKNGFVRKEVEKFDQDAAQEAAKREVLAKKLFGEKGKIDPIDISHEQALREHNEIENMYQTKIHEIEHKLGCVLEEETKKKIYQEISEQYLLQSKTKVERIQQQEEQSAYREEITKRNPVKAGAKEYADRKINELFDHKQEKDCQESFDQAIPNMINMIREKRIGHVICLEKRARFFRNGLSSVFKYLKEIGEINWEVMVHTVAPDYFDKESQDYTYTDERIKKERDKFLSQFPKPRNLKETLKSNGNANILLLDDYIETGKTIKRTKEGFVEEGFPQESVFLASLEGDKHVQHADVEILSQRNSIYYDLKMATQDIFDSDDKNKHLYHSRIIKSWNFDSKNKDQQTEEIIYKNELYLELSRRFKTMMLESLKKYFSDNHGQ